MPTTPRKTDVVEHEVRVAAPPQTVFAYFTDPARYIQWMGSTADVQAVPGGSYRVGISDGVEAAGEVVEVDPPRRLRFPRGWAAGHARAAGSIRRVRTIT